MSRGPGGVARQAFGLLVPVILLVALAWRWGPEAFARAGGVVTPGSLLAALLLGGVAVVVQALRWRVVSIALGEKDHGVGAAVGEVYRSAFLNVALPGALAGDVLRAWRRRRSTDGRWGPAAAGVASERLTGTAVLLAVACAAAWPLDHRLAAALLLAAVVAAGVTVRPLARLGRVGLVAVLACSALSVAALAGLFAVAAAVLLPDLTADVVRLGVVLLAATSVPLGLAGFGPREVAAALVAHGAGLTAAQALTVSVGYGLLAVLSVMPGAAVMALDARRGQPRGRQVEVR